MNSVLQRILETRTASDEHGNEQPLVVHIPSDEGEFFQRIIWDVRSAVTLEVGLAYGISTLYICEALREVGGESISSVTRTSLAGWGPAFAALV